MYTATFPDIYIIVQFMKSDSYLCQKGYILTTVCSEDGSQSRTESTNLIFSQSFLTFSVSCFLTLLLISQGIILWAWWNKSSVFGGWYLWLSTMMQSLDLVSLNYDQAVMGALKLRIIQGYRIWYCIMDRWALVDVCARLKRLVLVVLNSWSNVWNDHESPLWWK